MIPALKEAGRVGTLLSHSGLMPFLINVLFSYCPSVFKYVSVCVCMYVFCVYICIYMYIYMYVFCMYLCVCIFEVFLPWDASGWDAFPLL